MSDISTIDIVFLVLIALMAIRGYLKGFIAEFFSWASLIVSIWAAVLLHSAGAEFIRGRIMEEVELIPEIMAFAGIFIIVMLLSKALEHVLKDIVMGARLGGANRLLGAILGLVEGLTLTALILFVLSVQPLFDALYIIEGSTFAQILLPILIVPIEQGVDIFTTMRLLFFPMFIAV